MEFIEEVLTKSEKDHKVFLLATILAIICFYLVIPIAVFVFIKSKILPFIFMLVGILIPIVGFLLGVKIGNKIFNLKRIDFTKSKLYKKLEKEGIVEQFKTDINKEYNKKTTIKYCDEFSNVGLLVTETWFVFIDAKEPKYAKTEEVLKITDAISSNRTFMRVELTNNKLLTIRQLDCKEIADEIAAKYPNIQIEK